MSNVNFEDYLKERLYNHAEPVESGSWETILADIGANKRKKLIYRRFLYSATAAAVVILLLLLPVMFPSSDPMEGLSISLVDSHQLMEPSDSLHIQHVEQAYIEEIRMTRPDLLSIVTDAVPDEIEVVEKVDEIEAPVVIPTPDSTKKQEPPSRPESQRQPDTRYGYDREPVTSKRRNLYDKWSIALVSTYSNAAGESPFTPTVQVLEGKTKTINSASALTESQGYTALSFSPPISVGINFQKELYSWLSFGVGINYTLLQSKFASSYNYLGDEYTIRQYLHYVGLPVSALYLFVSQPKLRAYASVGGMVEKAVTAYSSSTSKYAHNAENYYVQGLQWSVNAGLGVEVLLSHLFGIYFEPGMAYFFDCKQPRSIRTVQPAQFKAEVGLRVRI